MISFRDQSWNIRGTHMVPTLEAIAGIYDNNAKAIVWGHNTHIGDARYIAMKDAEMWNVGRLVREKYEQNSDVYIVGFSSYEGSVIFGRMLGGKMEKMLVPAAVKGSAEEILHSDFRR